MKKVLRVLTISIWLCSTILWAQESEEPFKYKVGGYFGQNFFDDKSLMRDNSMYGIRSTVMLNSFYGLSLGYEYLGGIDIKKSSQTRDSHRFYMDLLIDGEEQYHVVPYITFGGGYELLSDDIKDASGAKHDVSQAFISAALGFKYNFIPEMSLFIESKALWKVDTTDVDYNVIAGFYYNIGATTCDNTYVTQRAKEKPEERNTIHTGPVNRLSVWKKVPPIERARQRDYNEQVYKSHKEQSFHRSLKQPQKIRQKEVLYLDDLERITVQERKTLSNTKHTSSQKKYSIIAGAFKTKSGLRTMTRRFKKNHISYFLKRNNKKGLTYVVAGVYSSKREAYKMLRKVKKVQRDAYIVKMK